MNKLDFIKEIKLLGNSFTDDLKFVQTINLSVRNPVRNCGA